MLEAQQVGADIRAVSKYDGIAIHGLLGEAQSVATLAGRAGLRLRKVDANSRLLPHVEDWALRAGEQILRGDVKDSPIICAHSLGAYPALRAARYALNPRVILLAPSARYPGVLELASQTPGVVIISGTHDLVTEPFGDAARIAAASPGSRHITLPGVGHAGFLPGYEKTPAAIRFIENQVANIANSKISMLPLSAQYQLVAEAMASAIGGEHFGPENMTRKGSQ